MRKSVRVASWAVYQASVQGQPGPNVVCTQAEWEALLREQPGSCRLIRDGIANEGEAERLARGASGEARKRVTHKKAVAVAPASTEEVVAEGPVILPFSAGPGLALDEPADERAESA